MENELTGIIDQQMTSCMWDATKSCATWSLLFGHTSTGARRSGEEKGPQISIRVHESLPTPKPEHSPPPTLTEQIFVDQS